MLSYTAEARLFAAALFMEADTRGRRTESGEEERIDDELTVAVKEMAGLGPASVAQMSSSRTPQVEASSENRAWKRIWCNRKI